MRIQARAVGGEDSMGLSISDLTQEQRRYFRDELRDARAAALRDAEGFEPIVQAMEKLGRFLSQRGSGFGNHREEFLLIASQGKSCRSVEVESSLVSTPESLFEHVRIGRNNAVHEGAHARHLVKHCIELALAIEDGLMADQKLIADFMVRSPICAEGWQPVAYARQQMLVNSYSYLPLYWEGKWRVLSDKAVAKFMGSPSDPAKSLATRIESAIRDGRLGLEEAMCVRANAVVQEVVRHAAGVVLVTTEEGSLLGIATFFDFL